MKPARILRLAAQLKRWASEREEQRGWPVSADELVARAKRREPSLTETEIAAICRASESAAAVRRIVLISRSVLRMSPIRRRERYGLPVKRFIREG